MQTGLTCLYCQLLALLAPPVRPDSGHPQSDKVWPVPRALYYHVGLRVILLTRLGDDGNIRLKAFEVPRNLSKQLLFCRLSAHHRTYYSDRIQRQEAGELGDWAGPPDVARSEHPPPDIEDLRGRIHA